MDKGSLKLECLKLAMAKSAHRGPDEILELAKIFEGYCLGSTKETKNQSIEGNSKEPSDSVKEHKNKIQKS